MKKNKRSIVALSIIAVFLIALAVIEFNIYKTNLNQKKAAAASLKKETKPYKNSKKSGSKSDNTSSKITAQSKKVDKVEIARNAAEAYIDSKDVGVYCIELKSGKSFGINQDKVYYAASTAKLPDILYTQKKLNEGTISVNTEFEYHDYVNNIQGAMVRGGTGVLKDNVHDGQKVNVGTLLKYSCSYSDNLAANMLGYYVCDKNDGTFKSYIGSVLSRNIAVFSKEFSAKDTAILMNSIYGQGGQAIADLQSTNWDNTKIPKYLPVKTAHKIGINGVYNHDVAVVYASNPYIISIMTKGENDEFIAQLSKKVYDELQ